MERTKFNTFISILGKIANNRYLMAIRNGMSVIIPLVIIGSCFTILLNFPVDSWKTFIAPWASKLSVVSQFTMDFMAIFAVIGIVSSLCDVYKINKVSTSALAVTAFLITTVTPVTITPIAAKAANLSASGNFLPMVNFGSKGLFTAILISIFTVEVVRFFVVKKLVIRMPNGVPEAVIYSFMTLIPGIFVILVVWTLHVALGFDVTTFLQWVFSPIQAFAGNNLLSVIIPILVIMIVWIFGIHGMIIATPLLSPFWVKNLSANVAATTAGHAIPNFMTEQFFQWFVWMGGAGATLGLTILLVFKSKSTFCKQMGRYTIIPGIFNINEPLLFGMPMIMNPYFALPMILAPLTAGFITYVAMQVLHLISFPIALVPWTLPAPIGALMATGFDWRAAVLAIFNILVTAIIYYPFFRAFDKKMLEQEQVGKGA